MNKLFTLLMTFAMLTACLSTTSISARAEENAISQEEIVYETSEYFADGSSVTIIVTEESTAVAQASVYSKTGSKHYIFFNKDKVEVWRFSVHGTFTVNPGISSTCTEDSYSIVISDDTWKNEAVSTYHSGNQAIGDATFIKKVLFINVDTQNCNVVLSCDSNGSLS